MSAQNLSLAILLAISAAMSGCARWTTGKGADTNYVTVDADGHHDTELARKDYAAARKCMAKYEQGKETDFAKMEKLLQASLAHDVRFGPAHHSLGVVYLWQKKLYLAAWEFEYAARVMPDRFEPLNNLGLVYESVGKYDQAKTFYLQAREIAPHQPEVLGNLARASFRSGETVDEMRPLLEDVLMADTRAEWRCWAAEKLGLHAPPAPSAPLPVAPPVDAPRPAPHHTSPAVEEELPLLAPPAPSADVPTVSAENNLLPTSDLIVP